MKLSVSAAAAEAPQQTAFLARGEAISYSALAVSVRHAQTWLELNDALDVERVALVAQPRFECLVTLLALMEAGVTVVPLHPRWTEVERDRFLEDCAPVTFLPSWWDPSASLPGLAPIRSAPDDDERPLAILATSGTNGRPKPVELSRKAFVASADASAERLGWRDDDRWLLAMPPAHVGGLSILTRCLLARRTVVVEDLAHFDPAAVARIIDERRVTMLSLVPTMLRRLLDHDADWRPPAHLRMVLVGGAAAPPALLSEARARGWRALATYGSTEACSQVATQHPDDPQSDDELVKGGGTCGLPLPGLEVRIASDAVIEVSGEALMTRYLPADVSQPFTEDGWLRTGDRGRLDDRGQVHVLGRADDVIVTGGENVDPLEVEQALASHPAVRAACVFGVADEAWGQVVAAVVESEGEEPTVADLDAHLRACVAGFKLPRELAIARQIPRTEDGMLDRRAIATWAASRLRFLDRG